MDDTRRELTTLIEVGVDHDIEQLSEPSGRLRDELLELDVDVVRAT